MAILGVKDEPPTMCCMVLAALQGDAMRRAMAANLKRAADEGGYAGLRAALLERFKLCREHRPLTGQDVP